MSDLSFAETLDQIDSRSTNQTITVAENWLQGRTCYGGMSAAIAARAAATCIDDDRPLRSLLVAFVGPVGAGDTDLTAETLRHGKSVTLVESKLKQQGSIATQMTAAFGKPRDTIGAETIHVMEAEPRDSVPPAPFLDGIMPGFLKNFEIRWTGGGAPATGLKDTRLGMWVRHLDDMSRYPAECLTGIADVPPPLMMSHFDRRIMASSLTWSLEFICPPAEIRNDWFYLDYRLEAASQGYSQQSGRVFDANGRLLAVSHQCMTYFP